MNNNTTSSAEFDEGKAMVYRVAGMCTIIPGLLLTAVVYSAFLRHKAFKKAPYKLILSLGLNDLLLTLGWLYAIWAFLRPKPLASGTMMVIQSAWWFNFCAHLMAIGINRFVYTVVPQYKEMLFTRGRRVYLWIIGCWMFPALYLLLNVFPQTKTGMNWFPLLCTGFFNPQVPAFEAWQMVTMIMNLLTAVSVFAMYVIVGTKAFIVARAASPLKAREIMFNIQQALVFVVFLIPVLLWHLSGYLLYSKHINTCSLNYYTSYAYYANGVVNPIIYLVFNKDLQKVLRNMFLKQEHVVSSIHIVAPID